MIEKLRQKKGETLVETMVSLLIAVLSMGLLASAVMASANVSKQTRAIDAEYKQELEAAECLEGESQPKQLVLTFKDDTGMNTIDSVTTMVNIYGEEDSAFLSYDYEPEVSEP